MLIKSALRDLLSVSYVMISTTIISHLRWLFSPLWCLTAPKGECIFNARRAVVWFSHGRKPDCEGFIQTGALYNLEAPYNNPRAKGASNLSPLRTFGPAGRQPSRRSRVNLREYWKAPPKSWSWSRSRPRRKAPEPTKKSCEKCASFPHSLFLFPYSFCSSASGAGASSSGVPSSSVSSAGSAVSAASPVSSGSSASTAGVSSFFSSTGG